MTKVLEQGALTVIQETLWESSFKKYKKLSAGFGKSHFDESLRETYLSEFNTIHANVMLNFMKESVKTLDRHKIASIHIVSFLKSKVIKCLDTPKNKIFLGNEIVAMRVAIDYMIASLNRKLKEKGKSIEVNGITYPVALSCKTPYFEICCRSLYYARKHYMLNELDIADRLFLLEYITLKDIGINPSILKEYE